LEVKDMEHFARVKPQNPRVGQLVVNVHFQGTLYRGGIRPTWYKIPQSTVAAMKAAKQESGAPLFDVLTTEEKVAVERAEEQGRLQRLGLAAETVTAAPGTTIDLTGKQAAKPATPDKPQDARRGPRRGDRATRAAAVPDGFQGGGEGERESGGGALSTADLPQNRT
jgi:hypothetical protein